MTVSEELISIGLSFGCAGKIDERNIWAHCNDDKTYMSCFGTPSMILSLPAAVCG